MGFQDGEGALQANPSKPSRFPHERLLVPEGHTFCAKARVFLERSHGSLTRY